MKRREFVEKLGVGSAVALVAGGALVSGSGTPAAPPRNKDRVTITTRPRSECDRDGHLRLLAD